MTRSESDATHYLQCSSDACRQGRQACPIPTACQVGASDRSWLWSDLSIFGIFVLVIVGFIAGVFS